MTRVAAKRGVKLTSRSRPLKPKDLAEFDYVIGRTGIAAQEQAGQGLGTLGLLGLRCFQRVDS